GAECLQLHGGAEPVLSVGDFRLGRRLLVVFYRHHLRHGLDPVRLARSHPQSHRKTQPRRTQAEHPAPRRSCSLWCLAVHPGNHHQRQRLLCERRALLQHLVCGPLPRRQRRKRLRRVGHSGSPPGSCGRQQAQDGGIPLWGDPAGLLLLGRNPNRISLLSIESKHGQHRLQLRQHSPCRQYGHHAYCHDPDDQHRQHEASARSLCQTQTPGELSPVRCDRKLRVQQRLLVRPPRPSRHRQCMDELGLDHGHLLFLRHQQVLDGCDEGPGLHRRRYARDNPPRHDPQIAKHATLRDRGHLALPAVSRGTPSFDRCEQGLSTRH
ncbi:uncharacterized protein BJ171DRAFT_619713, partial [Polychytrium aggregatum]|uniref:uncharacterized protein n=1 Tax=Polychytrium aggregatum TaxID=110093 RepID=UPI0022FEF57F